MKVFVAASHICESTGWLASSNEVSPAGSGSVCHCRFGTTTFSAAAAPTPGRLEVCEVRVRNQVRQAVRGLILSIGNQANGYLDVAVGAAASEKIIIPDLPLTTPSFRMDQQFFSYLPCSNPAGSRIAARRPASKATGPARWRYVLSLLVARL